MVNSNEIAATEMSLKRHLLLDVNDREIGVTRLCQLQ